MELFLWSAFGMLIGLFLYISLPRRQAYDWRDDSGIKPVPESRLFRLTGCMLWGIVLIGIADLLL